MKLLFSVPTGYHIRELLLPLKNLLASTQRISQVIVVTPAAAWADQVFPGYPSKFSYVTNPDTYGEHRALLRRLQPNLVITNTSGLDPVDVPILQAAQDNNLTTCTFIASWDNVWKMARLHRQRQPQVIADFLIVWNQMMKEHLLATFPDIEAKAVFVIGAPRLDFFFHHDIPSRQQLLDRLGFPDHRAKLIHFATTELYPMDYVIQTVKQAMSSRIKFPLHLLATVHPGGNIKAHQAYARPLGAKVIYSFGRRPTSPHPDFKYNPTRRDIHRHVSLFKHADLLINHSSTVALESIAGGTPVINVKYGRRFNWWQWYRSMVYRDFHQHYAAITRSGATTVVTNPRQLILAINDYLDDPSQDSIQRQALLKKMVTNTSGTASLQFLQLILQLTK